MLNFAQFSATMALNAAVAEVRGEADPGLLGRLQSSVADRNWDSIEDLWRMKEEIKGDDDLRGAFDASDTAAGVLAALEGSERGRRFVAERLREHQRTFGYKSIWSHEFAFKTWVEDPAPIIEAIRGYLATDYDYPSNIQGVRDDLEKAKAEVMDGVEGEQRAALQAALDRSLAMNPLTPDHHFFIDQGTNARLRLACIAIGRKLAGAGVLADAEDVVFLHYNEVRLLLADQSALGRAGSRLRPARRPGGRRRAPTAVVGRHRDGGGAGVPVRVALGLPREVPRGRAGRRAARSRASPRRPGSWRAPRATSPRSTSSTRSATATSSCAG